MRKINSREYDIQVTLVEWMWLQYPDIIFHCDLSGVRLPIGLAAKCKKINPYRAWPDIFIAEPRGQYHGLFIELKRSRDDLYKKDGKIRKSKHIQEQARVLRFLREKGYFAVFCCGFYETTDAIRHYLSQL